MTRNDQLFFNAYNRLDNYLQSLVKTNGHVNMIAYLEKISPEKKRAELKSIRTLRNCMAHNVNPNLKYPTVPADWIGWLEKELDWCKKNAKTIAPKLQRMLPSDRKTHNGDNERSRDKTQSSYVDYYRKMYGYETSKPKDRKTSSHPSGGGYKFVSEPKKTGLFSRSSGEYGWVICNHSGEFLSSTAYADFSSHFDKAVVLKKKKEAKSIVASFEKNSISWNGSHCPFFRIRCVKLV